MHANPQATQQPAGEVGTSGLNAMRHPDSGKATPRDKRNDDGLRSGQIDQ